MNSLAMALRRPTGVAVDPDDNYDDYHDAIEDVVCMTGAEKLPDVFKEGNNDIANSLVL